VFDGYNRGLHWERTCAEISKIRITRGPQTSAIGQPLSGGRRARALLSLQSPQALETSDEILASLRCSPDGMCVVTVSQDVAPSVWNFRKYKYIRMVMQRLTPRTRFREARSEAPTVLN
jgi:hypothetical protein